MARTDVRSGAIAVLLAVAVLGAGGCARAISGTPLAAPGQLGVEAADGDLLATTCRQFTEMKDAGRREVILAIGAENQLVGANPEIWMGVATALCSFADPGAPVRDVVTGGFR
jgi:hypothetical protein